MNDKSKVYLIILVVFGAAIRFWNFGGDCFHCDELFTYELVQKSVGEILAYTLWNDCNPPLFYLFDHFSLMALGNTVFAARFPSVVFGVLLIPAVYYLGREVEGEFTGLLVATLVATMGSMWYYSQFARSYMLICLLFTILCIYFVKLDRGTLDKKTWLAFCVVAAACLWTHLFVVVPVSLMFLWLIGKHRTIAVKWCVATALLCVPLASLVWVVIINRGAGTTQINHWPTILELVINTPLEFLGYGFLLLFGLIGYYVYRNLRERNIDTPVLLVGIAVLTFIVELMVSRFTPVFPRYSLFLVPVLSMIAMVPVFRFLTDDRILPAQRYFTFLLLTGFYYYTVYIQFTTGCFQPKGPFCI